MTMTDRWIMKDSPLHDRFFWPKDLLNMQEADKEALLKQFQMELKRAFLPPMAQDWARVWLVLGQLTAIHKALSCGGMHKNFPMDTFVNPVMDLIVDYADYALEVLGFFAVLEVSQAWKT